MTMTKEIKVAFKKLALDPKNVRTKVDQDSIVSLAASIEAKGILQNLIVRPGEKRGHYLVTGGGRRFRAVEHLINEGTLTADYEITCQVRSEDEATEISLAENVMRVAMDPADQFKAFKTLADDGKSVEDIAKHFGETELIVSKRLKLARVSPVLFELYEKGDMELSQLQAFTVSDDHEAQERVWNSLPQYYRHGRDIRQALTDGKIPASDKRIKYLGGLDAVRDAGGTVICDLFTDQDGGYVEDVALVEKMVADKIDAATIDIVAEGWKWVRYQPEIDYYDLQFYGREYPQQPAYSEEDRAELERLEKLSDEAAERFNQTGDEEDRTVFETADQAFEDLQAKYVAQYSDEQKALCGVIITIGYNGDLRVERGLIDPQDKQVSNAACAAGGEEVKETATHTKTLLAELTARKTAALRLELAKNADVALAVAVHSMAIKTLYEWGAARDNGSVEMSLDSACLESQIKDAGQCNDLDALERTRESWKSVLPVGPAELWDWCLNVSQKTLLELQAFCVAQTINAIDSGEGYNRSSIEHGDRIGEALGVTITDHFQPTAENYFSRVKVDVIHQSLVEACGEEAAASVLKMKKKEAAAYAAEKVAGTGWVPSMMHFTIEPPVSDEVIEEAA
ncbi:MAG: ParB N-terminal domain-containing protein [Roseibium sp.]|uniref:ParB/RepB/Spo0J family partition protein n=1 Tax=Roseibium sp. TaxID=1936156 RepID=UPI00261C3E96|nr:ParB/RepB/Spo0J family partition protein [Roseibium sp.]MCV0424592.1 ParB N-terminal domain-containing protein [Roseibium sp.]